MEKSLQKWMRQCQEGNKYAFEQIYRATSPQVFAMLMRMLRNKGLAEEVLQEGYLEIWRNAGAYHPQKGKVFSWVFSLIRYRGLDKLRSLKKSSRVLQELEPNDTQLFTQELETKQSVAALEKCMKNLPADQQKVILAAFYRGLSHGELAESLALRLGTVKTWIRRGLQDLRQCLEAA